MRIPQRRRRFSKPPSGGLPGCHTGHDGVPTRSRPGSASGSGRPRSAAPGCSRSARPVGAADASRATPWPRQTGAPPTPFVCASPSGRSRFREFTEPVEIVGIQGSMDGPALVAGGAGSLDGARVPDPGVGPVDHLCLGVLGLAAWKQLSLRTAIRISSGVVRELALPEKRRPPVEIGEGEKRPDARALDGHDVLDGAVRRVAGYLARS